MTYRCTYLQLAALALLVALLASGCGTYQFSVAGQCADYGTTAYALNEYDGMQEVNWMGSEDIGETLAVLAIVKGAVLWADYKWGNETTHNILGVMGFGLAVWNVSQIERAQ